MNGEIYDCGDGVPTSIILPRNDTTALFASDQTGELLITPDEQKPSLRGASIILTVLGQFVVTGMIAAGGDPVLGAFTAVAVVTCSLALVAAEALSKNR